jgi:hypothetical protein
MRALVAVVNLVLGTAYTGYGVMTAVELKREWRALGFSRFGVAWIFMAFTCGPHHLVHGVHVGLEGHTGGYLDLFSVVVGLPMGVLWLALRIEAFAGGRGDRFIAGTPPWLRAMPTVAAVYLTVLIAASLRQPLGDGELGAMVWINGALVAIYMAIGWFLLRTQLRNHEPMAGWSLSGISLTAVFPTCALMHAVWAVYALGGTYDTDVHLLVVDWLAVPAGLYFLWVVRGLYRDSLHDWNRPDDPEVVAEAEPEVAMEPQPAPAG